MNNSLYVNTITSSADHFFDTEEKVSNLAQGKVNNEYTIKGIVPEDPEVVEFLFSLGCFEGEKVTLISILSGSYVVSIKDARYSLGSDLAQLVLI